MTKARSTADQRQTVQHHTPTETEQNSGDLKSCLYQIAKCFSVPSDYLAKQLGGVITAVTYGVNALEKGNSEHFFVIRFAAADIVYLQRNFSFFRRVRYTLNRLSVCCRDTHLATEAI